MGLDSSGTRQTETANLLFRVAFLLIYGENLDRGTKPDASPQSPHPLPPHSSALPMAAPPCPRPLSLVSCLAPSLSVDGFPGGAVYGRRRDSGAGGAGTRDSQANRGGQWWHRRPAAWTAMDERRRVALVPGSRGRPETKSGRCRAAGANPSARLAFRDELDAWLAPGKPGSSLPVSFYLVKTWLGRGCHGDWSGKPHLSSRGGAGGGTSRGGAGTEVEEQRGKVLA
jgi:hypothetical protein